MTEKEIREIASELLRVAGDLTTLHSAFEAIRTAATRGCLYNDAVSIMHYIAQVQQLLHESAKKLAELAGKLNRAASES